MGLHDRFKGGAACLLAALLCLTPPAAAVGAGTGERAVAKTETAAAQSGSFLQTEKYGRTLSVDTSTGCFTVQSGEAVWKSVPDGIREDPIAKGKNRIDLQSLLVIRYGDPETGSTDTVNSQTGAVMKNGVTVKKRQDGVSVTFDFTAVKIRIPVEITLDKRGVTVSVLTEKIEEYGDNLLYELRLMPGFDAADSGEEGWMLIPDGSGALVDFNNGRSALEPYARPVYGADSNVSASRQTEMTEQALLPVLGLCHRQRSTLAVITGGDGLATLNAAVAGKTSSYNTAYPSFTLRTSETFVIGKNVGGGNASRTTVLYSTAPLTKTPLTVSYILWDWAVQPADMAAELRALWQEQGLLPETAADGRVPLYVTLYGALYKTVPVLGIPVKKEVAVTPFAEANALLNDLTAGGVELTAVRYTAWSRDAVRGRVADSADPVPALGKKRELQALLSRGDAAVYLDSDLTRVSRWQWRYRKKDCAAQGIGHIPTARSVFDLATTFPDAAKGTYWLLSPWRFAEVTDSLLRSFAHWDTPYMGMGSAGETLYSDYAVSGRTRDDAKTAWQTALNACREAGKSLLIAGGNAYAVPYAGRLVDIPTSSSRYDLFDRDVPFYQMVLHGVTEYAATAVNCAPEPTEALLSAVQTGSCLHYFFAGETGNEALGAAMPEEMFSTRFANWRDDLLAAYTRLLPLYRRVADQTITGFADLAEGVTLTTYADGTAVMVNFTDRPYTHDGMTAAARDFAFRLA